MVAFLTMLTVQLTPHSTSPTSKPRIRVIPSGCKNLLTPPHSNRNGKVLFHRRMYWLEQVHKLPTLAAVDWGFEVVNSQFYNAACTYSPLTIA